MRFQHILTILLFASVFLGGVALGGSSSSTDASLVCITEFPGCEGEVATIRIVQTEEKTIITVELCGESHSTSVPSDSSAPVSGTLTCCGPSGDKISPTGALTSSASTWGEVDDCADFEIS